MAQKTVTTPKTFQSRSHPLSRDQIRRLFGGGLIDREYQRLRSEERRSRMVVNGEDLISELPEDVITHILSFLETKHSVRTSALSKRWKNLCYSVPNLIFHLANIEKDTEAEMSFLKESLSFFDRRIRSLPSHVIHKFILTCRPSHLIDADELVKSWMMALIKAGVQQLCLETPKWEHGEDIKEVFTCKTLVQLKLGQEREQDSCSAGTILYLPSSIHLPNLKTLSLCLCRISIDVAERLFRSCPQLESLTLMADCDISSQFTFNISSSHLKHLVFKIYPIVENCKYEVVIDAPILETLVIAGHLGGFHFTNPPSVAEADIDVWETEYQILKKERWLRFLVGISSVRSLRLTPYMLHPRWMVEVIDSLFFPNLTRLKLACLLKSPVLGFLRLVPNLEYLKLSDPRFYGDGEGFYYEHTDDDADDDDVDGDDDDDDDVQREIDVVDCDDNDDDDDDDDDDDEAATDDDDIPGCLLSHMKVIEIEDNQLWRSHMPLVKYLQHKGKVLQKMVFHWDTLSNSYSQSDYREIAIYRGEEWSYRAEIKETPMGSKACEIEYIY